MKKKYAIKALLRIKAIQENCHKLKALGVDLIDYENGVNLIEESIALMFVESDKDFETALDVIQWWLYDNVDKVLGVAGKVVNVNSAEAFVDWLEKWYRKP